MHTILGETKKNLLILLAGLVLILTAETLGFFAGMDNYCHDLFFRLRGPAEPDNRILIAAVDEATLNRLGRWPLGRVHYARLLDRLSEASVVGFDILMAEPTRDDALLAQAIKRHGRVILPAYAVTSLKVADVAAMLSPLRVGHIHLEPEIDGVVRSVYHTLYAGGQPLPSLSSAIYETLTTKAFLRKNPGQAGRDPTTQARIIQMDPRRIDYYGPPGTFPRLSLADIIEGRYPDDFFKNRIVLVGVTAVGLEAGVLTPFTQQRDLMHGVEVHAHILNNLIDQSRFAEASGPVRWGVSIALSLLGLFLLLRADSRRAFLFWILGMLAVAVAALAAFVFWTLWFSPILFCFLFTLVFIVSYILRLERAGRQLAEAKEAWEDSFNTISDAIVLMDESGTVIQMNRAAETLLEPRLLESLARRSLRQGEGAAASGQENQITPATADEATGLEEISDPLTDRHFEIKSFIRNDRLGRRIGFVYVVRDITARKREEEERQRLQFHLLQAQKMQSIGRLAGGVAHDFNNLLTAILGYSELVLMKLPEGDSLRESVRLIRDSGLKAAALTRQLLAFSRKQVMELQVLNLNDIVDDMAKILTRIIGEDVTLVFATGTPVRNILADPVQMEQILLNLVVNARDAMPAGGVITVETADVEFGGEPCPAPEGIPPGPYVMLTVTDTGEGMSPEVQAHLFEPFFTTKEVGEGTGLGLSLVFGIVKQLAGHLEVFSEPGGGSVFKVYLPSCLGDRAAKGRTQSLSLPRGGATVLIADDDAAIRKLLVKLLAPLGYRVMTVPSGVEALRLIKASGDEIDLILTDVVMPGMGGKELEERVREIEPRIKVLFMSGYTEEIIVRHGLERAGSAFIQKPLLLEELAMKLREALDGK
ncbi:MAG: CHASE2 domain-containing protein [Deltaproteobacteria bacterium]|nr:CHASE2 domain-containing protein [Deltaproteobacteria bacterium]